jgi:ABC-type transporter Mla subunit MlaD
VTGTMSELQKVAQTAIQQAKQTSTASVSEMLETHNMLRADSTALYERLREANLLLQEVLTGAHQNMSVLENTMMMRVSDFVGAMKEVTEGTNMASESVAHTIGDFRETTARVVTDLGQLTIRFEQHGRELAKAIELIERSNVRTEDAVNERRVTLDSLISTLDIRTEDLDQRLKRFSALLDESLDAAGGRAREIARVVSESSVESAHVIADQFEAMREAAETERRTTAESMRSVYEQSTGDSQMMLREAAERFTEIMEAMKQMSGEMQEQLKTTREDLRRGIMELPQEAAEAAAQMRSELETTREELRRGIMELPQETAEAAADLWDRYKRGERNVFTRRLYTLQGQKAFDEIRAKYRTDREFKQTVDRYIAEFERLLEDVSRDDRGQVVARTYLTSETGKVYTMLAHAAGRFDQAQ